MALIGADTGLQREIDNIWGIDDHAHPMPLGLELPGDPAAPIQPYDFELPKRMRPYNPEYLDAWAALWGYEHRDFETAHLGDLIAAKNKVMETRGTGYNSWVLDQVKIDRMVNININLHDTLPSDRFPWCAHVEWTLYPFACEPAHTGPSRMLTAAATRKREALGVAEAPPTLERFIDEVILAYLADSKARGAVGIKYNTPYSRGLDFSDPTYEEVAPLYAAGVARGALEAAEHKAVQDYIFRKTVLEAGRLHLAVQMHTGYGVQPQFRIRGSNPLLMEDVFRQASGTRFMLLHGSWPFTREAVALMGFPNVYNDFSCADIYHYPRALSDQIRQALEWFPEKLMYGTDAYSDWAFGMLSGIPSKANPLHGWEEKLWIIDRTGRQALGLALSGMVADGVISFKEAETYVSWVMRDTVSRFHKLDG
ncbi:MAG: amidohydrolase family protein [Rhodobacteraceae bacterium]|nr:amidohydrolase family protein [Paracoccaceae bacterium]MBR9821017.1 amidohydrolase family protein [Paracoccaceae bacterium]